MSSSAGVRRAKRQAKSFARGDDQRYVQRDVVVKFVIADAPEPERVTYRQAIAMIDRAQRESVYSVALPSGWSGLWT